VTLLSTIRGPRDLRGLAQEQLRELADDIRRFLVATVAGTGGHLGPNLGAVELTIALHRVFDSPRDRILFDTGHQAYVHKLLTGRQDGFAQLRQRGGLSGYPSRAESPHDLIENSHASTALSYADGLAKAYRLRCQRDRTVVAVVGDGALTGGMAWEALNNIAAGTDRQVVVVLNDNGRSYAPTIGGLARHLTALRATHGAGPRPDDAVPAKALFEDLGLKYLGPVDGHHVQAVEHALRAAREFGGPVIVHCATRKGFGYPVAECDEVDRLHSPGPFDPHTGVPVPKPGPTWTDVFGRWLVDAGARRPDIVAITAAMLHPTGLAAFAEAFPDRVFDVGIAEQHAATSAAGLAVGGLHPVVAIYATFLNRAFDQVLLDVALHRLPVTFVLDRAGITGDDGPSHNGMWDLSMLQPVPGLRIAAPRDRTRLRELLDEAVAVTDGPTVVRFPKGPAAPDMEATDVLGSVDVLARTGDEDVLLVAVGPMAGTCSAVADRLAAQGIGTTVVDPRWVKPLDPALVGAALRHRLVAVVEDNSRVGGVGDAVARLLRDADVDVPVRTFGIPPRFLGHASRAQVLAEIGLTAQDLARDITAAMTRRGTAPSTQDRRPVVVTPADPS
jgi:1-deoxy-D-xylulose-5-phosphate synthase